jgi:POT family proton-dependent oligopeptide transporter
MPTVRPASARGLLYLAFTETWERFSFYGMQALLVLYMVDSLLRGDVDRKVLGFEPFRRVLEAVTGPLSTQALASQIFGLYAGLVYLTPVFGGIIGDRILGRRRTVVLGAVLMAAGHLLLAFDRSFLIALALLIVGCGCLKGNISTQVGLLYPPEDAEGRRRGYLLFNVGINTGAMAGPLICGALGETLGWHWGFGAAGVGMIIGMIVYLAGAAHLPAEPPVRREDSARVVLDGGQRLTILALIGVFVLATLYNIPFGQSANVLPLWLREMTDRQVFGFQVPVSWYLAADGLFTVAFTPLALAFTQRLAERGRPLSAIGSIALGCGCVAVADLLLALLQATASGPGSLHVAWGFVYFAICDWGYLFTWPIVLALVAQSAPSSVKATMMGVAFLSLFAANLTVGWLGRFYETSAHTTFWLGHAAIGGLGVVACLAFKQALSRRLSPVPLQEEEASTDRIVSAA